MGAYMYPIKIDREKQQVRTKRKVKVKDIEAITLDLIQNNVKKDETFYVDFEEFILIVEGKRLETDQEQKERITKEESYMQRYTEFHESIKIRGNK